MPEDTNFIVEKDTQAALDKINQKLKSESDLNQQELSELFYAIECEDSAMYDIICIIHATLDKNTHDHIQSLRDAMKQWAEANNLVF